MDSMVTIVIIPYGIFGNCYKRVNLSNYTPIKMLKKKKVLITRKKKV